MFSSTNSLVLNELLLSHPCGTGHGESRVTAGSNTGQKQLSGRHTKLPSGHGACAGETGPAGPHPSSCQAGKPSALHLLTSSSPLLFVWPPM